MNTVLSRFVATGLLILLSGMSLASDQDDARKAATDILTSLRTGQYSKLWESQTSAFYKSNITKNSFLANMTIGRQPIGSSIGSPTFVDMTYSQGDVPTGYKGEIYAFTFLSSYTQGDFYERIVVIKEQDGKFRMSGLWGAPASKSSK